MGMITLRAREGSDGIRALRAALKILRRLGLRAISIEQTTDTD
jgi:hypothetical protein